MAGIYVATAEAITLFQERKGSLKSIVYSQIKADPQRKKIIIKLASQTLSYLKIIEEIFELAMKLAEKDISAQVFKKELQKKPRDSLLLLYCYELLFGDNKGSKQIRKHLDQHGQIASIIFTEPAESCLKQSLQSLKNERGIILNEDLLSSSMKLAEQSRSEIPIYCRVNLFHQKTQNIINKLERSKQFHFIHLSQANISGLEAEKYDPICKHFTDAFHIVLRQPKVSNSKSSQINPILFTSDINIPNLLIFPPFADTNPVSQHKSHLNELIHSSGIIIQDRASCIPPLVLNPPPGSIVIDACAAPGNKTLQLAELVAFGQQNLINNIVDKDEIEIKQELNNETEDKQDFKEIIMDKVKRKRSQSINATEEQSSYSETRKQIQQTGKIFAFEYDYNRSQLLQRRITEATKDAQIQFKNIIKVINGDFLKANPNSTTFDIKDKQKDSKMDYMKYQLRDATHILLDPSCSGSGLLKLLETALSSSSDNEEIDEINNQKQAAKQDKTQNSSSSSHSQRQLINQTPVPDQFSNNSTKIQSLAANQLRLLRHSASFPKCQAIVYSTCSIYIQENENVVSAFLDEQQRMKGQNGFKLAYAPESLINQHFTSSHTSSSYSSQLSSSPHPWLRNGFVVDGLPISEANKLLRFVSPEDHTNGFFVARFERDCNDEENEEEEDDDLELNKSRISKDINIRKQSRKKDWKEKNQNTKENEGIYQKHTPFQKRRRLI